MPELPEVETVRRSLRPIIGRRIAAVEVLERRLRRPVAANFSHRVVGKVIETIERRGKYLLFHLSGGDRLLAHLGMSGALLLQPAGTAAQLHDHVRLRLSDHLQLTYNDPRRLGLLQVCRPEKLGRVKSVS